jgi:hypothetical protein
MSESLTLLARIEALEREVRQLRTASVRPSHDGPPEEMPAHERAIDSMASRRHVLRYGAAVLGAAAAAVVSATPAEATDGQPVLLGSVNESTATTALTASSGNGLTATVTSNTTSGLAGISRAPLASNGVSGITFSNAGAGVFGAAGAIAGGGSADGVMGQANTLTGAGVHGIHSSGIGVLAEVPDGSLQYGTALYAKNLSSYAGPVPGGGGFAIYGVSAKGHAIAGAASAPGAAAIVGFTSGAGSAAAFWGPAWVFGNFTVLGGAKSAAVAHRDGSHRRLYCVESPESWFEDFGKGRLENGCASVAIDPDFASVVDLTDYHVFLTTYGSRDLLTVSAQSLLGFRVEAGDSTSQARFSWRIVAKRKDLAAPRFEAVTIPPEPTLPPIPDVPSVRHHRS